MTYIILTIIFIIIISIVNKKTFYWETIIKYLWKQVYEKADIMASLIDVEEKHGASAVVGANKYEKPIKIIGNLINSILDFVNYFNIEKDKDVEEETFGYGRFDFDIILNTAKSNPDAFKKWKK